MKLKDIKKAKGLHFLALGHNFRSFANHFTTIEECKKFFESCRFSTYEIFKYYETGPKNNRYGWFSKIEEGFVDPIEGCIKNTDKTKKVHNV